MPLFKNSEFIQSIIRISIGLLTYLYISSGISTDYFNASYETLRNFAVIFFSFSFIILVSLFWVPASTTRRYLCLAFDISCATFSSHLSGGVNSVYVLVYLWIYIGYGTRYGKPFLVAAGVITFIGYNTLIIAENAWSTLTLDAIAFLLLIIALPIYLYAMHRRLQSEVDEARHANRAKTEFLSNMTHQIRTPIGGVVGMIDLLNKTNLDDQQQQYLHALSQSSNALQEIIEDIVDFSQIEQGNILFSHTSFQPGNLIDSLVNSLAPLAHEKNLEINCFIEDSFPQYVFSDAQRLRQLLSNLLRHVIDNAVTDNIYIHAWGGDLLPDGNIHANIEMSFTQAADTEHIYINDIPEYDQALALRIGSQLTRLMGGNLDLQYPSDSRPTLSLHFNWKPDTLQFSTPIPNYNHKTVLIYESDENNRAILENYCNRLGLETYSAHGHNNLIAHILWGKEKNKHFDLIIICETLKTGGIQSLLNRIRTEAKSTAPILYATYIKNISLTEPDASRDMQATITKPIAFEQLTRTIDQLLSTRTALVLPQHNTVPLHILIAEDSEVNASILYDHLTDMGHNVDIATDGNTALYAMHKHHYNLVFMDLYMPNLDGIEATQQWRSIESDHLAPLPIIAITAKATADIKQRCLDAGMNDFLAKPVSAKQLADVIHQYTNTPVSNDIHT